MSTWDRIAGLALEVDGCGLDRLERDYGHFRRVTTVVRLRGGGEEGIGEDVTYEIEDHDVLHAAGAPDLAGRFTLAEFAARAEAADLFPAPPVREPSCDYRRWAFESAALDLALRQAGRPLHDVLGREPQPLRFVASTRLGEPPSIAPVLARTAICPGLHFKLDPENSWTPALLEALQAATDVDVLDLKGLYRGTPVDVRTDPALYRMVAEAFPEAWLEDPDLSVPEAEEALAPHRGRITWDANLHRVADVEALPFAPRTINVKPSRFGSLEELLGVYDLCAERGIGMYGGGQSELGPGRGQIQYLASLFHADMPNDVAPAGYNEPDPDPGLPCSPMDPVPAPTGFRWGEEETG